MAATDSARIDLADRQALEDDGDAEHREEEAQQHVDGDLGRRRRQERRRRRGRVGVGVRQPDMQRKQRELQRDADGEEGQRGEHRPRRSPPPAEALGDVGRC